jgi:Esterase-like activity of phytase
MLSGLFSRIAPAGSLAVAALLCLTPTASVPLGLEPVQPALFIAQALPVPQQPAGLVVAPGAPLRFDGGVMLRAWAKRFGGFSGMVVERGALRLVSDAGAEVRLFPRWGQLAWPGRIRSLPEGCFPGTRKQDRDSESLAIDPATGMLWVGLESINSVCRYKARVLASGARQSRELVADSGLLRFARNDEIRETADRASPATMADWPRTNGPESLTRLRDGRFVAIAEGANDGRRGVPMLVFSGDPLDPEMRVAAYRFVPPEGFRPVEVAEGPDGHLLVVLRSWHAAMPRGPRYAPLRFATRIMHLPPMQGWTAGQPVTGTEILRITDGDLDDNYEGIATSNENGQTFVWLVSDNNYSPFQRNLLLRFRWTGQVKR